MKTACSRIASATMVLAGLWLSMPAAKAQSDRVLREQERLQRELFRRQQEDFNKKLIEDGKRRDEENARLTREMSEANERNARMQGQQPGASGKAVVVRQNGVKPQPAPVFGPAPLQPPAGLKGQALRNWINNRAVAKLKAAGFRPRLNR